MNTDLIGDISGANGERDHETAYTGLPPSRLEDTRPVASRALPNGSTTPLRNPVRTSPKSHRSEVASFVSVVYVRLAESSE